MNSGERGAWRRSSFCADAACVEVRECGDEIVMRNRNRPDVQLRLARWSWREFVKGVAHDEFD